MHFSELVALIVAAILLAALAVLCGRLYSQLRSTRARFAPILDLDAERVRLVSERDSLSREIQSRREQLEVELVQAREANGKGMSEERDRHAVEMDSLVGAIRAKREWFEAQMASSLAELERLQKEVGFLEAREELHSFGFYRRHYDLDTSDAYRNRLDEVRERQAAMLREKTAAVCTEKWQVDGSAAKGKQMTDRYLKLQLRAFNGECDASVSRVRYNNAVGLEERMRKSFATINKLGETQKCRIVEPYLELRIEELRLEHEYALKLQEEKEEQRRIRERLREEEVAQREFEQAQREAEKEEARAAVALEKARAQLGAAFEAENEEARAQIAELEAELAAAHAKKEQAVSRAQLTRSGHVYIISNEGSFGQQVFKVGMTRRLDPLERIKELGDASVPFGFDVHAIIFTEDAPSLEARLHRALDEKRVNLANFRKEFFATTLDEIEAAICGCDLKADLIRDAEAAEYRQTCALRAERIEIARAQSIAAAGAATATVTEAAPSPLELVRRSWDTEPAA